MEYRKIIPPLIMIIISLTNICEAVELIHINSIPNKILFGKYEAIQESNKKYTSKEILKLPEDKFKQIISLSDTNFGTNYHKIWLRFKITNSSHYKVTKILSNIGLTKNINIYTYNNSQQLINESSSGFNTAPDDLPLQAGRFAVPIILNPNENISLIVEFSGYHLSEVQFKLQDSLIFQNDIYKDLLFWCLFYGIMFGLFIYNFLMYITHISNKSSLYYSTFIISICIYYLCFFNPFGIYQLQTIGFISNYIYYAGTLAILTAIKFILSFLETKTRHKRYHLILMSFIYSHIVLLVIYLLVPSSRASVTLIQQSSYGIMALLLSTLLIFDYSQSKKRSSLYILIAWTSFSLSITLGSLYVHHMIMTSEQMKYVLMLGSVSEIIFMSLALTEKINEMRRFVLNQYIDIQKQLTQNLEIENQAIKRAQKKVKTVELLAALGEVASSLAHEINNPLTIIQGNIRKCLRVIKDSNISNIDLKNVTRMKQFSDNIAEMVRSLHFLGTNDLGLIKKERFSFNKIIELAHESKKNQLLEKNISLIVNNHSEASIYADKENLIKAYANLIQNSIDSLESLYEVNNKEIKINIRKTSDSLIFEIIDSGPGIISNDKNQIFTAFYSTRKASNHIGLGLNFAKKVLEANEGFIETQPFNSESSYYIQTSLKVAS